MNKIFIKQLVRENLLSRLREAGKNPEGEKSQSSNDNQDQNDGIEKPEDKTYDELSKGEKKKVKTLTNKIKNATQGPNKILKLSQVAGASGAICGDVKCDPDDAAHRSYLGKAVSGKPDADGKVRHLSLQQANSMGKVVDNPPAYN